MVPFNVIKCYGIEQLLQLTMLVRPFAKLGNLQLLGANFSKCSPLHEHTPNNAKGALSPLYKIILSRVQHQGQEYGNNGHSTDTYVIHGRAPDKKQIQLYRTVPESLLWTSSPLLPASNCCNVMQKMLHLSRMGCTDMDWTYKELWNAAVSDFQPCFDAHAMGLCKASDSDALARGHLTQEQMEFSMDDACRSAIANICNISITVRFLFELDTDTLACVSQIVSELNVDYFLDSFSTTLSNCVNRYFTRGLNGAKKMTPNMIKDPEQAVLCNMAINHCLSQAKLHLDDGRFERQLANVYLNLPARRCVGGLFINNVCDNRLMAEVLCGLVANLFQSRIHHLVPDTWSKKVKLLSTQAMPVTPLTLASIIPHALLALEQSSNFESMTNLQCRTMDMSDTTGISTLHPIPEVERVSCFPLVGPFDKTKIPSILQAITTSSRIVMVVCDGETVEEWDFYCMTFGLLQCYDNNAIVESGSCVFHTCTMMSPDNSLFQDVPVEIIDFMDTMSIIKAYNRWEGAIREFTTVLFKPSIYYFDVGNGNDTHHNTLE